MFVVGLIRVLGLSCRLVLALVIGIIHHIEDFSFELLSIYAYRCGSQVWLDSTFSSAGVPYVQGKYSVAYQQQQLRLYYVIYYYATLKSRWYTLKKYFSFHTPIRAFIHALRHSKTLRY